MIPIPDNIKYQAVEDITLCGIAYVTAYSASGTGTANVSNYDAFADGNAVTILYPEGDSASALLKSTGAVNKSARTLTFSAPPTKPLTAGCTIFGPKIIDLGGTTGGVTWGFTPELIHQEYDQVPGHVETFIVHWDGQLQFTLPEFDLKQWGILSGLNYTDQAADTGVKGQTVVELASLARKKYGAILQFAKQDPTETVLKDFVILYRVSSIQGINSMGDKRSPTSLQATLKALIDPQRPKFHGFGRIIQELLPAEV